MTKEDKDLLLKDLCARLPYGVKAIGAYEEEADYNNAFPRIEKVEGYVDGIDHIGFDDGEIYVTIEGISCELSYVKPYLRPMSSISSLISAKEWTSLSGIDLIDWYNANYIDYRGLIKKGLAIAVTEDNNPYKG